MKSIKESRMFSILLQLEEQEKRYSDRIDQLKTYKMAQGAKNALWLLTGDLRETRSILAFMRKTLSTEE